MINNYHNRKFSKKNPFVENFLRSAVVFLIILTVLFSYITISNIKKAKTELYQSQVDLLAEDWGAQMKQLEDICLRIRINPQYQPSSIASNQYQEILLLQDFEQYTRYSVLTDECFLYYREKGRFFLSSGCTTSLDYYVNTYAKEAQAEFIYALTESNDPSALPSNASLFLFFPLKFDFSAVNADVILGYNIKKAMLESRFQMVSGGLTGIVALYRNGTLLYTNQNADYVPDPKQMLTATTSDGQFTFCYYPNNDKSILLSISPVQFLLFAIIIVLLFLTALFFAQKTYRPVQHIAEKYGSTPAGKSSDIFSNALEEIDNKLSHMQQRNITITYQLSEKQRIIRIQLLHELLHGKINYNLQPFLEQAQVSLPGPYYYVTSIQFESAEEPDAFIEDLQEEIEHLTSEEEGIFIYTLTNPEKYQINVICSIREEQQEQRLNTFISEIVNSASYWGVVGLGNPYQDIHKISASWLESVDNIHNAIKSKDKASSQSEQRISPQLNSDKTQRFFFHLANGDARKAYEEFENYMVFFGSNEISFLQQQYMFTSFVGEFSKVAISKGIVLGNRNLALMLSADKASAFRDAVNIMMQEYFEKFRQLQQNVQEETFCEICKYLHKHYMDYDISVEQIAEHFRSSTAEVRQAIVSNTGYKYKEYVILLRIELAKKLLLAGCLPISEICTQVGYSNVSHFVTLFKKQTGMSPTEYRQYYKNAEAT